MPGVLADRPADIGLKPIIQSASFRYDGLLNLSSFSFNTVQGWNLDSGFSFRNWKEEEKGKSTSISTKFNFGF